MPGDARAGMGLPGDSRATNCSGPPLDVAILGGGPVGCALALALAVAGRSCALFERRAPDAAIDSRLAARPLALSYATRLILERLGAWRALAATAIETIHVSQAGVFGKVHLSAREAGVPALGYVVEYSDLISVLRARVAACDVQRHEGVHASTGFTRRGGIEIRVEGEASWQIEARCAVHAEGSSGQIPGKRYQRDAVSGLIEVEPSSAHAAFERFTPEGPLALLPMAGAYALIWSARPERAQQLHSMPETAFLAELEAVLGSRAGKLRAAKARQRVPVVQQMRPTRVAERAVFIGNAAQTLHPVAGQGLNLGFRDAWELGALIGEAPDPGDADLLQRYSAKRRFDAGATSMMTDLLASQFASRNPLARGLGGLALAALDMLPGPRRFFTRRMIYGLHALP